MKMFLACFALLSCALGPNALGSASPTTDLKVSVGGSAFVMVGRGMSCLDVATAQAKGIPATPSIMEPRTHIAQFVLEWNSNEALEVSRVVMTLTTSSKVIFSTELGQAEIKALLGRDPKGIVGPLMLDSDGPLRTPEFPACGLAFGGLPSDRTLYPARLSIEVHGLATDAQGVSTPVVASTMTAIQNL